MILSASDGIAAPAVSHTTATVRDSQPPAVHASVAQDQLWPPNHGLVNVGLCTRAHDACSGALATSVTVLASEAVSAGSVGLAPLRLRAERNGDGNGRIYLVIARATDPSRNTAVACASVVVPHDHSARSVQAILAEAAAARAFCASHGAAPAGYVNAAP